MIAAVQTLALFEPGGAMMRMPATGGRSLSKLYDVHEKAVDDKGLSRM
jgi:hypothetical protein